MNPEATSKYTQASQVFRPGAPIDDYTLFAGRVTQVARVLNAVNLPGQHIIVYGERGVGKTSLANVLTSIFSAQGQSKRIYIRVNCDSGDTFASLWRKIFADLVIRTPKPAFGFSLEQQWNESSLANMINDNTHPEDLRRMLGLYTVKVIIVIDELDRISNKDTCAKLADTIKTFSDHYIDTTLILVGVADSVEQLIAEHASIERCLVQIHMPRMSMDELEEIINKALEELQMTIRPEERGWIAYISQGLPHYTHLLGLHSAQHAILRDRDEILQEDVIASLTGAVNNTQGSTVSAYHRAISSTRATIFEEVLMACALAKKDELGYFVLADVRAPLRTITGKPYEIQAFSQHLKEFCETRRGPILQKEGTSRRFRFRFINSLMPPYIVMYAFTKGLVRREHLTPPH